MSDGKDEGDRELIRQALAGQRDALVQLYGRICPAVHAEIAHLLMRMAPAAGRSSRQELEDLVQEAMVALWDHDGTLLRRWDPQRGRSLEGYVRMVSRSRALDVLRSRKRSPWTGESMDHETLDGVVDPAPAPQAQRVLAREQLRALYAELQARLSGRDQALFQALFVEEESPADVAVELGMTPAAVYQWSSRFKRHVLPRVIASVTGDEPQAAGPVAAVSSTGARP